MSGNLAHQEHNAVGTVVTLNDRARVLCYYRRHPGSHVRCADKAELVAKAATVKTCPHVNQSPSTVTAIVYVDPDPFAHAFFLFVLPLGDFFLAFLFGQPPCLGKPLRGQLDKQLLGPSVFTGFAGFELYIAAIRLHFPG